MITALAYIADVWILGAYAVAATSGRVRWFHLANAVGCYPILAVEVVAHAWPALILTAAFGAIGTVGVARSAR